MAAWPVIVKISWYSETGCWGTWDAGLCTVSVCCCRGGWYPTWVRSLREWTWSSHPIYAMSRWDVYFSLDVLLSSFFLLYFCLRHKVWLWPRSCRWLNADTTWQDRWSQLGLFAEGWQDVTEDRMWHKRAEITREECAVSFRANMYRK